MRDELLKYLNHRIEAQKYFLKELKAHGTHAATGILAYIDCLEDIKEWATNYKPDVRICQKHGLHLQQCEACAKES